MEEDHKTVNEMRSSPSKSKLLHVTNQLYKEGIFAQMRWTYCNKTNNFKCCQYRYLIRVIPEEPNLRFGLSPQNPRRNPLIGRDCNCKHIKGFSVLGL